MKPLDLEKKIKLANDIIDAICPTLDCAECPIDAIWKRYNSNSVSTPGCAKALLKAFCDGEPVAVSKTETTTQTCSKTEQVPAKPELPTWCKAGQWMFDNDGALCEIIEVQPHQILVRYPGTKLELRIFIFTEVRPVRFREYTFEEACGLIGKTIYYVYGGHVKCAKFVTCVEMPKDTNSVIIDGRVFQSWKDLEATIDGVPFGVPEIDTEAEKEEQQ